MCVILNNSTYLLNYLFIYLDIYRHATVNNDHYTQVFHRITPESPLWTVTAESLLTQEMEIIVILEGIVEATGMTTQVNVASLYFACCDSL